MQPEQRQREENMRNTFLFIVLTVLLCAQISALGITPGRITVNFSPGLQQHLSFTVVNSEHKDLKLVAQARGALNGSVYFEENVFTMPANQYEKKLDFELKLPSTLTPGLHVIDLVVIQIPDQTPLGQATVGTALAVTTQLYVRVPYPGKYMEGELNVLGNAEEKKFYVRAASRGSEKIDKALANIAIFSNEGREITRLKTDVRSFAPGEQAELVATWKVDAPLGRYVAKAVLDYDHQKLLLEEQFEIGDFVLELLDLFVTDFTLGSIAKFNLVVQNRWNEAINKAYAQMRVLDKDFNELADISSSTYDIPAGEKTTTVYYWDTKDIKEGLYNANVLLFYADKKTQQDLKLAVGKKSIQVIGLGRVISSEASSEKSSMTTILFVIIGFLIALNILWFLVFRNRKK